MNSSPVELLLVPPRRQTGEVQAARTLDEWLESDSHETQNVSSFTDSAIVDFQERVIDLDSRQRDH